MNQNQKLQFRVKVFPSRKFLTIFSHKFKIGVACLNFTLFISLLMKIYLIKLETSEAKLFESKNLKKQQRKSGTPRITVRDDKS